MTSRTKVKARGYSHREVIRLGKKIGFTGGFRHVEVGERLCQYLHWENISFKNALKKYFLEYPNIEGITVSNPKPVKKTKKVPFHTSDNFLMSFEWRRLRMQAIEKYGARCQCCGATPKDGIKINVDHIKPRKIYPELALSLDNLQILCDVCNHGKGNWSMTDWREEKV